MKPLYFVLAVAPLLSACHASTRETAAPTVNCGNQAADWPSGLAGFWRNREQTLFEDTGIVAIERDGIVIFGYQSGSARRIPMRWTRLDACRFRGVALKEGDPLGWLFDGARDVIERERADGRDTLRRVEPEIEAQVADRRRAIEAELK